MVACLNRMKRSWHGDDDDFRGPIVSLMMAYAIEKKKKIPSTHSSPLIALVTDDVFEELASEMEHKNKSARDVESEENGGKRKRGSEKKSSPDGAFRVPMISQYGDTPSPSSASERESDVDNCNLLDKLFRDFEGCVHNINETIAESCAMYLESEILKKKTLKWNAMKLKHLNSNEASTHDVKTHEEVEAAIDAVYTEKTPQTRFNVLGLEALNLSKRLDSVWVHEESSEVAQTAMHTKTPWPKRTIILPPMLRLPYVSRVVSLRAGREKAEEIVARCIVCGVRNVW